MTDAPRRDPQALREAVARLVVMQVRLPGDYARFEEIRRALAEDGVGGILLFGGDDDLAPRFLRRLRQAAEHPLLVASDVERGVGQQVEGCLRHPPPMAIGALRDPSAAFKLGAATALECRRIGIDIALAPVLDLYNEPRNPIVGTRSFGADPEQVARLGVAWIEGCQEEGVLACAKHFPGHGRTLLDSHDALPVVEASAKDLRAQDLLPFARACRARVGTVMTAHVAYPGLDPEAGAGTAATLSRRIVHDLLREEMGYGGLVLTDALLMEGVRKRAGEGAAAVEALAAGCNILICTTDHREIVEAAVRAVEQGRLDPALVEESLEWRQEAIDRIRSHRPTAREVEGMDEYRAYAMARASVATLRDPGRLLPLPSPESARIAALILDDDDREGREEPVRERIGEFRGGVFRVAAEDGFLPGAVLPAIADADRVLLLLYGDVRAWKGRAGLSAGLEAVLRGLEPLHAGKILLVSFGSPLLAAAAPRMSAVCAWDDAPIVQRAAMDLLMGGREPGGVPPFRA